MRACCGRARQRSTRVGKRLHAQRRARLPVQSQASNTRQRRMARNGERGRDVSTAGSRLMDAPGAHVRPRGTSFRVHAPNARRVAVVPEGGSVEIAMTRDGRGAWHVDATDLRAGMLYRYRVDDALYPD